MTGMATHKMAGSDGVMRRTTVGGVLFHTDTALEYNAW